MSNLKELRQRQKSTQSAHKLTSAMMMVSRAKFNRTQIQWRESRVTLETLQIWASRSMAAFEDAEDDREALESDCFPEIPWILQQPNDEEKEASLPILLILCTSDKGLCGGFNPSLVQAATTFIQNHHPTPVHLICVGQKGLSLLQRIQNPHVVEVFSKITTFRYEDIHPILESMISLFRDRHVQKCYILSSHFKNALIQEPTIVQLLPYAISAHPERENLSTGLIEYGPNPYDAFDAILNVLFRTHFYVLMQEHVLSEHNARLLAMDAATENAKDMMDKLEKIYHHMRQSLITEELIEIVAGAEAL